jgi:alkylation response protein AidB-like acyl-CoA dehydrogenase
MDVEFSAEQEELRASLRRFLSERAPMSYVRSQWGDPNGISDDRWQGLVDLGVTGLLVPETLGGAGAGLVTAGVVLEELGRALLPGPYVSTAVTVPALLPVGRDDAVDELLADIAAGRRRAAFVDCRPAAGRSWARDAASVDTLVMLHDDGVLLRPATDAVITPVETIDGSTSFAEVTVDEYTAFLADSSVVVEAEDVARAADCTLIADVVAGVGTAARALELAVDYAKERHQFGQPIGSFQAVQHLCADMLIDLELGRSGAYYALWAADEAPADERHRAATMAKAWASDAFHRIGATAIQVFGGIGYTWEHDVHLFYKRLLTLQHVGGGTRANLEELAHLLLD